MLSHKPQCGLLLIAHRYSRKKYPENMEGHPIGSAGEELVTLLPSV